MNIAITGEGIVSAIGLDKAETLRSLRERRSGIGRMRHLQSAHTELPVGEVSLSDDEMKQRLGIAPSEEVSRTALLGMLALEQALGEAHLAEAVKAYGGSLRVLLISGTTVGGMDVTERHFNAIESATSHPYLLQHDCGSCTQLMADHFGLFCDVATISTACSSAANALMLGARLLKAGEADVVVAGGTEALSVFHLNGFNSLMILDHEPCRPFCQTRAGLNLGEGAAFVVLEDEEQARERGVGIHGYLTGYGNACDAFHQTASSDNGEGATLAMEEALRMAGLAPTDIQYVNAHGTGTPNNDQSESAALRRVFGGLMPKVSSTKSFTGHTTSASGSIETVICLLAMQHRFIPANLGWTEQMPDGITPTLGVEDAELRHVVCNSFGFGGNDTSLILSTVPTGHDGEIFPLSENTIRVAAKVEIDSVEQLSAIRDYVKPLEARRMGKLAKATLLSSMQALADAGVDMPDAVITGTAYGCLENSEKLLVQLRDGGEEMLSPTHFMQSTHNTIGSTIAIKLHAHGYNTTYTQGERSLAWALRDARLLLRGGRVKSVLVGCHDESTPVLGRFLQQATGRLLPAVKSVAMVLVCGE